MRTSAGLAPRTNAKRGLFGSDLTLEQGHIGDEKACQCLKFGQSRLSNAATTGVCVQPWSKCMSLIGFRCPNTGREVATGIDTDRAQLARMRNLKISVSCPDCPDGHGIPANEMFLVEGVTPAPHLPDPRGMQEREPLGR